VVGRWIYRELKFHWRNFRRWWTADPFKGATGVEKSRCHDWGVDSALYAHLARKAAFTTRSIQRQLELKSRAEAWIKENRSQWTEEMTYDQVMRATSLAMVETPIEGAAKQLVGHYSVGLTKANDYARLGVTGGGWFSNAARVPLR